MAAAVAATKKALDPNLRGHIEVAAFVEWWPTSKFATPACENTWIKELNAEALRTQLMSDALHRQVEAQAEAQARAAAEAEAEEARRCASVAAEARAARPRPVRRAEAAVQEAHSGALREALVVVEEMADVSPSFLHDLHTQLNETSPLMARARGGPFAQLVHHKSRATVLMAELEASAASELAAREAASSRLDAYAARAEAMHRKPQPLGEQAAEWLRAAARKASTPARGSGAPSRGERDAASDGVGDDDVVAGRRGEDRAASLARFDLLAKRALLLVAARRCCGGRATIPRTVTVRELSATLAREADVAQAQEIQALQSHLDGVAAAMGPRESMPIDEHLQLLCAELFFKQRQQLASVHALEHRAIASVVARYVETLAGPSPSEDSAVARMRVSVHELRAAESFARMMKGQLSLTQQLDALHDVSRNARQAITSFSTQMQSNPTATTESGKQLFSALWRSVTSLEARASQVSAAIRDAVGVSSTASTSTRAASCRAPRRCSTRRRSSRARRPPSWPRSAATCRPTRR